MSAVKATPEAWVRRCGGGPARTKILATSLPTLRSRAEPDFTIQIPKVVNFWTQIVHIRSSRAPKGCLLEAFLQGGARSWLSRLPRFATAPGGRTTVLRVNYDPRERSFPLTRSPPGTRGRRKPARARRECRMRQSVVRCTNRHGGARERRDISRLMSGRLECAPRVPVMARTAGCSRGTRAPPALRRPLRGGTMQRDPRTRREMRKGKTEWE